MLYISYYHNQHLFLNSIINVLLSLFFCHNYYHLYFNSAVYMQTRSHCEGNFGFPIIHSVENFPDDTRLLNLLRQNTEDVVVNKHSVQLMGHTGSIK